MESLLIKINQKPLLIVLAIVLLTVYFFIRMIDNSQMETNLDEYMPQSHPAFVYSDEAEEIFDIKDGIIIAVENAEGIYNKRTLQKITDITRELGNMKEINKNDVGSIYTADNIFGTELGLDVTPFYTTVPDTDEELQELRRKVRDNDMVYGRMVSHDENIALVIAEIESNVFSQEFYHSILDLAESFEGPEQIYIAGSPIVEGEMAYLGPKDMQKMVPIVIVVIIIILLLLLRSIKYSISVMLVVLLSVIWTFGLKASLNIPIYAVSTMIPVMLVAIGVAYGIHLFSHMELFLQKKDHAECSVAINDMIKQMWKPVVMTSITTAIGFISLLTSQVYPIKYFGLFSAFGVLSAMVLSLVFIPAYTRLFGYTKRKKRKSDKNSQSPFFHNIAKLVLKNKLVIILLTVLVIAISIYGVTKVWINSSFLDNFEKDSDIVQTDAFINKHFGGTSSLNVILEADREDAFKSPAILTLMDELQTRAEIELPDVGNSFSLSDFLKRMNKVMHEDDEEYDRIPDSAELNAQYLLLYEMSGDPDNLWKVVDYDYRMANLTLQLKSDDSKTIKGAIAMVEQFENAFAEHGVSLNYAGSGYKALVFTDLILEGQIKSLILSLIIIVILLSLMFKKVLVGLIGAIPITITALIGFGVMGLFNIPLSTTTALVSSIAIGIGIDYAVHFIDRYRTYAKSYAKDKTVQETMHHSGRAISYNAMVVIAGFLVLLFSVFPPNRSLGALVSLNMFTSFLGTVTIMLILLYRSNLFFKKPKHNERQDDQTNKPEEEKPC